MYSCSARGVKVMNRVAVFIPYFGKSFPSYFPFWLKSAGRNSFIDFHIYTDIEYKGYEQYENVLFHTESFADFCNRVQKCFDFKIKLENPYKCCDFKCAYGEIFKDLLENYGYDYWGYCDIDLIFGDLAKFLYPAIEQGYEKIGLYGHLSLYKNNDKLRSLFKKEIRLFEDALNYQDVFATHEICFFDEIQGMGIRAKENAISTYVDYQDKIADVDQKYRYFRLVNGYEQLVFQWRDGKLISLNKNGESRECIYAHFQKRSIKVNTEIDKEDFFWIVPNQITDEWAEKDFSKFTFIYTFVNRVNYWKREIIRKLKNDKSIEIKKKNTQQFCVKNHYYNSLKHWK